MRSGSLKVRYAKIRSGALCSSLTPESFMASTLLRRSLHATPCVICLQSPLYFSDCPIKFFFLFFITYPFQSSIVQSGQPTSLSRLHRNVGFKIQLYSAQNLHSFWASFCYVRASDINFLFFAIFAPSPSPAFIAQLFVFLKCIRCDVPTQSSRNKQVLWQANHTQNQAHAVSSVFPFSFCCCFAR